jgi:Ca2+-binding RTX toxin-like protein
MLTGGTGADLFRFGTVDLGRPMISDFETGVDRLAFSAAGYGGGMVAGMDPVAAQLLVLGTQANEAEGQFIYRASTGTLWWDADGTGAGRKIVVSEFQPGTVLSATDFQIVA